MAVAGWAKGYNGTGISVGVLDSGVDPAAQDIAANLSNKSIDMIASRNNLTPEDRHGTAVAEVIAAPWNGYGIVGVAYKSTILSVRSDTIDSCKTKCSFSSTTLAQGLNYVSNNGVRVINMSLGGDSPMGYNFETALKAATDKGIAVIIAAGNESLLNPDWPGRYAIDPRFSNNVLVVGAVDKNHVLASYSNKAGVAAARYLVAPGSGIVTDCHDTSCYIYDGTSLAAPHVAGAVALLLQAFPNLKGSDAIDILLKTAKPLSQGTSSDFGVGEMDLTNAFNPIGTQSLPGVKQQSLVLPDQPGEVFGSAFGDGPRRAALSGGLRTVMTDSYQRRFEINLGQKLAVKPAGNPGGLIGQSLAPRAETKTRAFALPETLGFATGDQIELGLAQVSDLDMAERAHLAPQFRQDPGLGRSSWSLAARFGALSLASFRREVTDPQGAPDWTPLIGGDISAGQKLGLALNGPHAAFGQGLSRLLDHLPVNLTLGAEAFSRIEHDPTAFAQQDVRPANGVQAGLDLQAQRLPLGLSLRFGRLKEPQGPLGGGDRRALGLSMQSRTDYGRLGFQTQLGHVSLSGTGELGAIKTQGSLINLDNDALISSFRLQAIGPATSHMTWSLSLSQPPRLERGHITALLADLPQGQTDDLQFSSRRVEITPSGRQLDLRLGLNGPGKIGPIEGQWSLGAQLTRHPGHVAGTELGTGVYARFSSRF